MNNLKEEILQGFNWNLATQAVSQVLSFIIGILLARLLSPREFGLIAMITVFFSFADVLREFGIGVYIIQKQNISERELSVAFWLSLSGGVAVGLFFVIIAPLIAVFYDEPIIHLLTLVLALNFLFSSLSVVPGALLQKALAFKSLFQVMIYTELLSSLVAIALAANGYGVWSLVARIITRNCTNMFLSWSYSWWRPSFYFNKRILSSVNKFSLPLISTHAMNYWVRNLDDLLIGKVLGERALGDYSRAYSFLTITLGQAGRITNRFVLPVFSRFQADKLKLGTLFLKLNRLTAVVFFPLLTILFFTSKEVVMILLGDQWEGVIPLLKIFAVTGIFQVVVAPIGIIFLSLGQTKFQFRLSILTSCVGITSIIIGLSWGVIGVASGLLIATVINIFPNIYFSGQLVQVSLWSWVNNLKEVVFCNLLLAVELFWFNENIPLMSNLWVLLGNLSIGTFTYLLIIYLFKIKAFSEMVSLIRLLVLNFR